MKAKPAKVKPRRSDRRKTTRTVHVIDRHTTYRDEQLARADLTGFLTKRY